MVALGIDLGTSNCCVAYVKDGIPGVLSDAAGNRTTPSAVSFYKGEIAVGKHAFDGFNRHPKNVIYGVKYLIGRKYEDSAVQEKIKNWSFDVINQKDKLKIVVSGKYYNPEEISAIIIKELKRNAEKQLKVAIKNVVITIPTYFNDAQRQATIDAGKIAGFEKVELLNEPTAAAIAYGIQNSIKNGRTILVFDLGGGTFDVSILRYNKEYKVLAIDGNIHTGGDDIDDNISKFLSDVLKKEHGFVIDDKRKLYRLKKISESAKCVLSNQSSTLVEMYGLLPDNNIVDVELTRNDLNEANKAIFKTCIDTVENCLKKADITAEQIDSVLLVGGSTRIPELQNYIKKYFGKSSKKNINPDEAVAIGAAIYASKLQGESHNDLTLDIICAHSLGVELITRLFSVLIPRFSPIPISKSKEYFTVPSGIGLINIYAGEEKTAIDNELLGKFTITGVCNGPKGRMILVTFAIDNNGILNVTAVDQKGKAEHLTVQLDKGTLTKAEVDELSAKIETEFKTSDQIKLNKLVCPINKLQTETL